MLHLQRPPFAPLGIDLLFMTPLLTVKALAPLNGMYVQETRENRLFFSFPSNPPDVEAFTKS
jgi:hypothetical protein